MIPHKWIIAAIRSKVQAEVTLVTDIEYPGMRLDKRGLDKWLEVDVLTSTPKKRTRGDKDRKVVQIAFKVLVKSTTNIYEHQKIAAQIAEAFDNGQCWDILDRGTAGMPKIGTLIFREPTSSNRTPDLESRLRTVTRCHVITLSALAQES